MRRLSIAGALLLAACAQAGTPPGGPPDDEAPLVVRIRPDTNATQVRQGAISFSFNEVISERPQGFNDLAGLFIISPSLGDARVSWRRTNVSVSPRGGLRPNTTYSVTMLPGLTDLEGNVDSVGASVVFSTGPEIAQGAIRGIVFDWLAERTAPRALIEAIALPDSTRYLTVADSAGRFELAHLPPGIFLLRATIDQNKNRQLDVRELFDTTSVALVDTATREILAYVHDSLGPGIQAVTIVDSLTLRVTLDRPLDTAQVVTPDLFSLKQADSTVVALAAAMSSRDYDKARDDSVKAKATQDSITAAAKADSVARADSIAGKAPPPRALGRRRDTTRVAARPAVRDSAREPPPKPSVPAPVTEIVLQLSTPLQPGTNYRLRARDLRSLLGHLRTSERVVPVPKPKKTDDSTRKDSTGRDTTRRDTTGRDTTRRDTTRRDTIRRDTTARDTTRRDTTLQALFAPVRPRPGSAVPPR